MSHFQLARELDWLRCSLELAGIGAEGFTTNKIRLGFSQLSLAIGTHWLGASCPLAEAAYIASCQLLLELEAWLS